MSVIDSLWEQAEPNIYIGKAEFIRSLDGWTIEPVEIDGDLAYVTMTNGPEFHFTTFGKHRGTIKMVRDGIQPVIDQHGFVLTRTPKDADRQHRFNRLIGFVADGEDEFFIHYRMEKLTLHRTAEN